MSIYLICADLNNCYYIFAVKRIQMSKNFIFPPIISNEKLEFEELSANNYHELVNIFENDTNPFIQEEYKSRDKAEKYYHAYQYFRNLSSNTNHRDWFIKLKKTGEYIGLINLYDLAFEGEYSKICSIGYATGEKYRGKGWTKDAVRTLIAYAFEELNLECVTASTLKENIISRSFLHSLGFSINMKDHDDDLDHKYFELRKS